MRLRVIAVGTRMPAWVDGAVSEYSRRLPSALPFTLTEVPSGRSGAARGAGARARGAQGDRTLAELTARDFVVTLDERGRELTTRELASWLGERMQEGRDLAFVIGGPDGLSPAVRARGDLCLALSRLTLPHALARVLLAEQLYRAASILRNHPYHRA